MMSNDSSADTGRGRFIIRYSTMLESDTIFHLTSMFFVTSKTGQLCFPLTCWRRIFSFSHFWKNEKENFVRIFDIRFFNLRFFRFKKDLDYISKGPYFTSK